MSEQLRLLAATWPWVLVAVVTLLALWGERQRLQAIRRWFSPDALALQDVRPVRRRLPLSVGILSLFCLAMAVQHWAEPPSGTRWLVLDVSRSMAVRESDGRTRWQQAREVLEPWLAQTRQPVGIIAFQHDAWLVLAPTRDRDAQRQALHQLAPRLDRQGSNPDAALRLWERLRTAGDLVLVVSDGEWEQVPAARPGTVLALGCGDPAGGAVPLLPGETETPTSRPDAASLSALSGNRVAWASAESESLSRLERAGHDEGRAWALLALALLVCEAGLTIGSRYRLGRLHLPYAWLQRYALWRTRGVTVLIAALLLSGAAPTWEARWQGVPSAALPAYNEGVRAIARGDRGAAEAAWREAVRLDPAWQPAWYNLGTLLAADPATVDEGRRALQEAVRLDPNDAWAAANLAALAPPSATPKSPNGAAAGTGRHSASTDSMPAASAIKPAAAGHGTPAPGAIPATPAIPGRQANGETTAVAPGSSGQVPARVPSPLPLGAGNTAAAADPPRPLTAAEIDRLLSTAEQLPAERLGDLRDREHRPGPLPSLSAEQIERILALAARIPPAMGDRPDRHTAESLVERAHRPGKLTW